MRTSTIALAVTLAVAAPLTAQANTRTIEFNRIVGDTATAEWDYTQGDVVTYVNVVVSKNAVNDNESGKSSDAFVALAISQSSISTGNVIITGSGYTSDFDFSVDRDLKMATLHAKNLIFQDDNSFTFFNVDIDLNWSATGSITTATSHDHVRSPGMVMLSMFKGDFRDASATGSIFGKDIQFTPMSSTQGQLQHNKFGTLTITTGKP
jgi:hypothetical protein